MSGFGAAYADTRRWLSKLATSLPAGDLGRGVPACPRWSVRDLLAHVVANATDALAGRIEGAGSEEWTARQIDERRELSIAELLDEWERSAAEFEPMLDAIHPAIAGGVIGDLVTHEHDARGALDRPGGRDSRAFTLALDSHVRFFGRRIKEAGLPALEVRADGAVWTAGPGDPEGKLEGEPFELLRSLTGRRTRQQVGKLAWSVDPAAYMPVVAMYDWPERELPE